MTLTLYSFLNFCSQAILIYEEIGENMGTNGDLDLADSFFQDAKELKDVIEKIKSDYQTNNFITFLALSIWLESPENIIIKDILIKALQTIKLDKEVKVKKMQEDILFSSEALNSFSSETLKNIVNLDNSQNNMFLFSVGSKKLDIQE